MTPEERQAQLELIRETLLSVLPPERRAHVAYIVVLAEDGEMPLVCSNYVHPRHTANVLAAVSGSLHRIADHQEGPPLPGMTPPKGPPS